MFQSNTLLLLIAATLPLFGYCTSVSYNGTIPTTNETGQYIPPPTKPLPPSLAVPTSNITFQYVPPPTKPLPPRSASLNPRSGGGGDKPAVWYTYYYTSELCNSNGCRVSSDGYMQVIQLDGDGFTLGGTAQVGIFRTSDSSIIWGAYITPRQNNGFRDGSWGAETDVMDCFFEPGPHPPTQAFIAGYDDEMGVWSESTDIGAVGCSLVG